MRKAMLLVGGGCCYVDDINTKRMNAMEKLIAEKKDAIDHNNLSNSHAQC